jgi:hypothetical protein
MYKKKNYLLSPYEKKSIGILAALVAYRPTHGKS